jgi:hypothetical protein
MISQYFIGGMTPESANPVQQSVRVIEIRPFKAGWQCYEGPGVQPYWTGDTAKEDTLDYATAPAKFEGGEFRGLIFHLLRDNSKSGCSLFSESLAENRFARDNCCSSLGV